MNLILSFSGRRGGNCDAVADFLAAPGDKVLHIRDLDIHPCARCDYECFQGPCKYRADDTYGLYAQMPCFDKVILIVPMYCGNPCSLYFAFNERCQDYFMHNDTYEEIIKKLYIIGIYGSGESTPDFIPCFEKWFNCSSHQGHVLGIQRHQYGQKLEDSLLDIPEVRNKIQTFLGQ